MIKVTVVSSKLRELKGVAKVSGKPYHMAFQDVYLHTVNPDGEIAPFPEKVEHSLDKNPDGSFTAFQPGEYTLQPSSVYVDRDGKPALSLRLTPLKQSKPTPV